MYKKMQKPAGLALIALCGLFTVLDAIPMVAMAAEVVAEQSSGLQEIVVTARRREENVQNVPIAIDVISGQALQENNVVNFEGLQYLVPSMTAFTGLARDQIDLSIRGQGANASGIPGVIAYLNEVPIPDFSGNLVGGPGLFFDLQNIQVLKGPQGTLFGRNSVGGAVLLETARPTNDFGGHVQVTYGNYNDRELDGAINLPMISDVLLARVAINGQVRDGFTFIQSEPGHPNGIDGDNLDHWSLRGTITFRPVDNFQNDTIATFQKYTSHGSPQILTDADPNGLFATYPGFYALFLQQQALGVRVALPVNVPYVDEGDNLLLSDIARWNINDSLTFRNIVGFDAATQIYAKDSDNTVLPIAAIPSTPYDQTIRQITEEAQLLGKSLAGHLNWILGAFYLDQAPPKNFEVETEEIFGFENDNESRNGAMSRALFAQGTYDLSAVSPGVSVTGGLRYTWDHRSQDGSGGQFGSVCTTPQANCGAIITASDVNSKALTWTAGVDYQATPSTLLYLTSRRGYRAGGYNQPGQPNFSPEYVNDVEIGVKSDWKAGAVPIRTNADLYYQDYSNIQTTVAVANESALTSLTANAAAARIMGAELEALAQLTTNLQLGVNFDYLDFDYTHLAPGVANAQTNAQLLASRSYNRPPRKYGVNGRYQLPLGSQIGEIAVRANWNWQASTTNNVFNAADGARPSGMIESYGLLNLSADWNNVYRRGFDVSLFASNATNKVYSIGGGGSAYSQIGYANGMFGDPRMYGIRVRYRFGAEAR